MSVKFPKKRAENLNDKIIEKIVRILDDWSGPRLTWELLIKKVFIELGILYTRQALSNHVRIKAAVYAKKQQLLKGGLQEMRMKDSEQQLIDSLKSEIKRLKRENNALLEQFNRWVYNGYLRSLDKFMLDFMNQPLPQIYREPSVEEKDKSRE
ncbi:hypothetical protein LQR30_16870 [Chromobacterium piscinae]|uniref:hypothetical protein n=1 Tax=Chromobacterium piscinae TaxID=686831 RepID=UPI001E4F5A65|nr:hypothetical protein [Chromobacterium piscinae]MCD4505768.1 hypothetical protein [Chromobacterium piscinae]